MKKLNGFIAKGVKSKFKPEKDSAIEGKELENLKQDEVNIEADGKCGFYCGGDGCIYASWKCDGDCDCNNCSDEMNCSKIAKGDRRKGEKTE